MTILKTKQQRAASEQSFSQKVADYVPAIPDSTHNVHSQLLKQLHLTQHIAIGSVIDIEHTYSGTRIKCVCDLWI